MIANMLVTDIVQGEGIKVVNFPKPNQLGRKVLVVMAPQKCGTSLICEP